MRISRLFRNLIFIFLLILTFISGIYSADIDEKYDLVIMNGRVMNPENGLDEDGLHLGIKDGEIRAMTRESITGKETIDASGLIVAPGFIDILSYATNSVGVWNKLADGITTNLCMHGATIDAPSWFTFYEKQKPPLHFGGSFIYTQARMKLKINHYQPATDVQIASIVAMAEKALADGCLGISMSMEYVPGISAAECLAMMQLARKHDVAVYYHLRYSDMEEPGTNIDAINEVLDYARVTGAAVHIMHITSTGGTFSMKESLSLVEAARKEGFDITACMYPYDYWATYLNSARFDAGWESRFRISYKDLQLGGSSERLTEESFLRYQKMGKLAAAYAIPEEDVREGLRCPWIMMGSDGILEPGYNNHPRASGMCARLIGHYVRDEKVLSLMDALAKLTIMPARRMEEQAPALKKKGRIVLGADADLTLFNFEKIIDRATVEHPEYQSDGIHYVLVGGKIVKDPKGFRKDVRNGRAIKRAVH